MVRYDPMHSWRTSAVRHGAWPAFFLLLGVYLLLALAYGAATPDLEAPDAGAHFRYAAWLREHPRLPLYDLPTALVSHELVQQPPLYYALVAGLSALLRPAADLQATVDYEQAVLTPYFEKGLGKRATVSPPDADPAVVWPLRLARGVSLLGGALLVTAAYVLARALLRGRLALPLAVAAAVAFNPQFLFTSTTITNDVWAAALSTAAVAAAARAARRQGRWWAWLGVGALCGLATLAKYSGVITLLPVALLAVLLRPAADRRSGTAKGWVLAEILREGLFVALGFLAVTGMLFAHNWAQTGELFPMQPIRNLLPGLTRPEPLSIRALGERLAFLTRSYTGIFGYGVRAASGFFELVDGGIWLAALGWTILLGKSILRKRIDWRRGEAADLLAAGLISLLWLAALVGSLAVWIRIMIAGEQGRLLFPAAAAAAMLLVLGWIGWLPRRSHGWLSAALCLGFVAVGAWQLGTVQATYATPAPMAGPVTPSRAANATFAPGMQLIGFDLPAGAATEPGRPLPLTLYFTAAAPIREDYTLFLHLVDGDNRMLYQFDGIPFSNRHPPRQWRLGEVFADHYEITPTETITGSTPAMLSLGFYPVLSPADRVAVYDAAGSPSGDRLHLAPIRILPPGSLGQLAAETAAADGKAAARPALARWENGIVLEDVAVAAEQNGSPQALALRWRTDQLVALDYTVFVQALDAAGNLVAQVDQQPQGGQAPTSTWLAGERIADRATFAAPPADWQQIIVGLYDPAGRRLLLASEAPSGSTDYFVVLQRPS